MKCDIIFNEASMLKKVQPTVQDDKKNLNLSVQVELEAGGEDTDQEDTSSHEGAEDVQPNDVEPYSIARGRARREVQVPLRLRDTVAYAFLVISSDPCSYQEAMESKDNSRWLTTMEEEMESLYKNKIWDLVTLPKGKKAIDYKWVYRKNEVSSEGEHCKYKVKLVMKDYA